MNRSPAVIVVDDDEAVRSSLRLLLKSAGHTTLAHASAREFLDTWDADQPGCLVLDVRMPGMSGIELKAHLDQIGRYLPVIFISGESLPSETESPQARQAVAFLWKPFKLDQLRQALEKALAPNAG